MNDEHYREQLRLARKWMREIEVHIAELKAAVQPTYTLKQIAKEFAKEVGA